MGTGYGDEVRELTGIENALTILRSAIHSEIAGQRFYLDASFTCIDPRAKEVFATLARDEEEHSRLLLLEYESLTSLGRWQDPVTVLSSDVDVDITRFSFPDEPVTDELFPSDWQASQAVDRRSDDMDALAIGIHLEIKAIELYGDAAAMAQETAARQAYEFLVSEENRHLQQLKDQWERLADMPWL